MLRERLDQWCESGILGLVLAILFFSPLALGAVRTTEFVAVMALTAGMLVLWALRLWIQPKPVLLWPPICWVVIAFGIYAMLRAHWADVQYDAQAEALKIAVYIAIFFGILNNLYNKETCKIISLATIFLGACMAFYALYQFLTASPYVWHFVKPAVYGRRSSGTFICPNSLAGYLEMLAPLAIVYALASRLSHATRLIVGYAGLAILAGIAVSLSRGGWVSTVAALVVLAVVLLRSMRYRLIVFAAIIALGIGIYAFYQKAEPIVQHRLQAASGTGPSRDLRLRLWPAATKIWLENPVFGAGPGQFDHHYRRYREPVDRTQNRPIYAHNDYLNTLADYGLVGFGLISMAFMLLFRGVARSWHAVAYSSNGQQSIGTKAAFLIGASAGLVAILVHSLFDFNMHIPANAILAVTWMALLSAFVRFATDDYWVQIRWTGRILATLFLTGAAIYLGIAANRCSREAYWLEQMEKAPTRTMQIRALERALQIAPNNYQTAYLLGEAYRLWSWEGIGEYQELAKKAMPWYFKAMELNPLDPYSPARIGMCLHWLGRHDEAEPWFQRALELDPNNCYIVALMGWHKFQLRQYGAAFKWFELSRLISWHDNPFAATYYDLAQKKMAEQRQGNPP